MKGYKHIQNRTPPGPLPLFPEPYPGEAFYSVLCRYHVRSGNAGDWHTSNQLFGYNSSLTSTLLTPFHLEMVNHWGCAPANVTPEKMLRLNTAFNLYGITAVSSELDRIQDVVHERKTTASFPRWMHPRLINQAGYLRYCPECAAVQKKLYGEPYWQLLPQIDEVEYCPVHRVRIRNSQIPLKKIRFHYYPASSVLMTESSNHPSAVCDGGEWEPLFDEEKDFFIKLAESIDWLLQYGESYAGYRNLIIAYNKFSGRLRNSPCYGWVEVSKRKMQEAFSEISHSRKLYSYLEHKNPKQFKGFTDHVYSMRVCSHVMVMTAFSGNPKTFYDG